MEPMTTASVQEPADQDRKAPGRPRNAQADHAIIQAVLDLLSSGQSADALSIEAVAAKAGVGKATIYRRWANKEALLVDAVATMKGPLPEPAGITPSAAGPNASAAATSFTVPSPPHATTMRAPRSTAPSASSRACPPRSVIRISGSTLADVRTSCARSARRRARSSVPRTPATGLTMTATRT